MIDDTLIVYDYIVFCISHPTFFHNSSFSYFLHSFLLLLLLLLVLFICIVFVNFSFQKRRTCKYIKRMIYKIQCMLYIFITFFLFSFFITNIYTTFFLRFHFFLFLSIKKGFGSFHRI